MKLKSENNILKIENILEIYAVFTKNAKNILLLKNWEAAAIFWTMISYICAWWEVNNLKIT